MLLVGMGSYPAYCLRPRGASRRGPAVYGAGPAALARLGAGEVRRVVGDGALIVDVRPVAAFAAGHVPGSLSIPLREAFATWLGWLADAGRPLVFVLGQDQDRDDVVRQALNVGYEYLAGELAGGIAARQAAGLPVRRVPLAPAPAARGLP